MCIYSETAPPRYSVYKPRPETTPTSMALVSMRVRRNGIFSGNFSLVMATSKQSPKSMCRILPVSRSNIRLDGCLERERERGRE